MTMSANIPTSASPPPPGNQSAGEAADAFEEPLSWKEMLTGVSMQSFLGSMVFHAALMVTLALVLGTIHVANKLGIAPEFDAAKQDDSLPEITHFEVGYTPIAPSELSTETLNLTEAPKVEAQFNDNSPIFVEAGGGTVTGKSTIGGL